MTDDRSNEPRLAKWVLGLFGALVIGALGNGLWELLVRPGLTRFGGFITSGFAWADRAVYTGAALDPTSVPALFFMLLLAQLPLLAAMYFLTRGFLDPVFERSIRARLKKIEADARDQPDRREFVISAIDKTKRNICIVGAVGCLLFAVFFLYAYTIHNRSVLIWRTFHQNIEICGPYLTEQDRLRMRADFRAMDSNSDFSRLRERLDEVGKANGIELDWLGAR